MKCTAICRIGAIAIIVSLALGLSLWAQTVGGKAPARPGWHPRVVPQPVNPLSPSDRTAVEAKLAIAEALVTKISGYGVPRGFEVRPFWHYNGPTSRDRLTEYRLVLWTHIPSLAASPDGNGGPTVVFNPGLGWFSEPIATDENGEQLYIEARTREPLHGATFTYGIFGVPNTSGVHLLFTSGDQSPMLQVTREQFLRAELVGMPAQIDRPLRDQLAKLSPTERTSPAWVNGTADLVSAGTPGARAVVRENPGFYRARRSPYEARAIIVNLGDMKDPVMAAQRQWFSEFDWAALKRVLDN